MAHKGQGQWQWGRGQGGRGGGQYQHGGGGRYSPYTPGQHQGGGTAGQLANLANRMADEAVTARIGECFATAGLGTFARPPAAPPGPDRARARDRARKARSIAISSSGDSASPGVRWGG